MKIVETGCIKIPMRLCCKPDFFCEIDPTKSQNGAGYRFQNGSFAENLAFSRGPQFFWPQNGTRLTPRAI